MATYDLEQQEKLAEFKAWWDKYGNTIVLAVALGLLAFAAIRGWDAYKRSQSVKASVVYSQMEKAAKEKDAKKLNDLAGVILEDYPRTAYAPLAAFTSAKFHVEQGDRKTARAQLEWVVEHAREEQVAAIARVRLAHVLLDMQAYDEAIKVLDGAHPAAFEAQFAEARGDVYVAQGKKSEARAAYEAAYAATPPSENPARELLRLKLDVLGS
jgi:predicted negative regulator of RcsB-dependent stress response